MSIDEEIQQIWEKGTVVAGFDPRICRQDACGAWMRRSDYGNRDSIYGWEIDHINPSGGENITNKRPLQWHNNLEKSDGNLKCNVRAVQDQNRKFN